jgi:tetratricopeptide (TPR) repeat protein
MRRAFEEVVMIRLLIAVSMIGLAGISANGQQVSGNALQTGAGVSRGAGDFPDKPELLRRIAMYETAIQNAKATHPADASLAKIYLDLGGLYGDAAMYLKAEDAMRQGILLLRRGPQDKLAEAIGHLAVLHIGMGELREAEKEELEALRVRESVGEPVGTAETWNDLADVYVKQRQYKKAVDYATKAMEVLGNDPKVSADDRIAVRQTLGYALCGERNFEMGVPLLQEAIEMAKSRYGADSLEVGVAYYLLGYASWQNGDLRNAAEWMGWGITRMKVDMGWGHPVYLNAVSQYAQFLRQQGQMEAADAEQREVRQAQAVVDVRTFTAR